MSRELNFCDPGRENRRGIEWGKKRLMREKFLVKQIVEKVESYYFCFWMFVLKELEEKRRLSGAYENEWIAKKVWKTKKRFFLLPVKIFFHFALRPGEFRRCWIFSFLSSIFWDKASCETRKKRVGNFCCNFSPLFRHIFCPGFQRRLHRLIGDYR